MEIGALKLPLEQLRIDNIRGVLGNYEPDTEPSRRAANQAAVALTLHTRGDGPIEVLFIKRAEKAGDPWSGHMAFPGGRREKEDSSLIDAAIRETQEEVGLSLSQERLLGRLDDAGEGRIARFDLAVSCFVFDAPPFEDFVLSDEVDDIVWIPLSFLANVKNVRPYHFPLAPEMGPFPSFQFEGHTVWGLTYRMLASFMSCFNITLPLEESSKEVE